MIQSMTGYGQISAKVDSTKISIQLKSFNNKYFDLTLRIPESIADIEDKIREIVKNKVRKGKVNLVIECDLGNSASKRLSINQENALLYYKLLSDLKKKLSLEGGITLNNILSFPDVISCETKGIDKKKLTAKFPSIMEGALEKLVKSRLAEGEKLYADFAKRVKVIGKEVVKINKRFPHSVREYRARLNKNISSLNNMITDERVDRKRIELEVAMFAKDSDVQEEVTRLSAHLSNFRNVLMLNGELGRRLDFICQEMQREANTIGQRANDFKIAQSVIKIKCEIDRIRQQVQNVL